MDDRDEPTTDHPLLPGIVVRADWVAAQATAVADGRLVLADVRWYLDGRSGRVAFEAGHLPGARFVDLDADLAGPAGGTAGRHPLPSPEAFAAAMTRLGVADGVPVVAYDDSGGGTAGRLVWMLSALGHPAALLDGGLAAWPGELAVGPDPGPDPAAPPAAAPAFTPRPWPPEAFVDAAGTAAAVQSGAPVLDARAPERYRGEVEPVDARAGHVPGARNAPWSALLDPATGRLLAPDVLRERFAAVGVTDASAAVVYCGSGVSACADLVALDHAGLGRGRLYVGSWSGWAADPERPAATGDRP